MPPDFDPMAPLKLALENELYICGIYAGVILLSAFMVAVALGRGRR